MSRLISKDVKLLPDCIGDEVKAQVDQMQPGDVILLENLRFHAEEQENDEEFARKLAELADIFINAILIGMVIQISFELNHIQTKFFCIADKTIFTQAVSMLDQMFVIFPIFPLSTCRFSSFGSKLGICVFFVQREMAKDITKLLP